MLSENRIYRDCSGERAVSGEACASHAHLCNVCWPHIRAYLSECPVDDETHRAALLDAGDRFVLDLVSADNDDSAPLASRDVPGYSWLSLSATAPSPPPQQQSAPPAAAIAAMAAMAPLFVHCATCAKPLANGLVINALGKSFHSKRCFACRVCQVSLADDATPFFDDGSGFPVCEVHARDPAAAH